MKYFFVYLDVDIASLQFGSYIEYRFHHKLLGPKTRI